MFKIENESELRQCFRPIDRDTLEIPGRIKFPLFVRDYLAWRESSGHRTYLVVTDPESQKTLGVAFRNDSASTPVTRHCEWCHSSGGSSQIGLLVADASDRKSVGIHLCRDLSCQAKLESRSQLTGENTRLLARTLNGRISDFLKRCLF